MAICFSLSSYIVQIEAVANMIFDHHRKIFTLFENTERLYSNIDTLLEFFWILGNTNVQPHQPHSTYSVRDTM